MRWLSALLVVLMAGCAGSAVPTTTTGALESTSTSAVPATSSTTQGPSIGCPGEAGFVASGQIGRITQPASDSRVLGLISRQVVDGCERFGFDFDTTQDAPATTPPSVTASFLEGNRVIRIDLGIDRTVITDQLVETALVSRVYVVRSLEGSLFVDIHLRESANARVTVSNSPARLLLELNPGSGELAALPAVSDHTVLISPSDGATVGTEFEVTGYARSPEASVLIVATSGDEVIFQQSTTAADWVDTWGEFSAEVALPEGVVNLFVGEESPNDGGLDGVTLTLTVQ